MSKTAIDRYKEQSAEWQQIRDGMIAARPGQPVTAHQVTTEQRKRMLARGERPVTLEEIYTEAERTEALARAPRT